MAGPRGDKTVEAKERGPSRLGILAVSRDSVVSVELPKSGAMIIGRDPDVDVQLAHPEVSRRHARLLVGPIQRIEDLGSANGTLLRGERLKPQHPSLLEIGETVSIGPFLVVLKNLDDGPGASQRSTRNRTAPKELVLGSPAMRAVVDKIDRIAKGQISVLLLGETGTGKEVLAQRIHETSGRSGRMVTVNCAAISATLFESELFGHERAAFTGAEGTRVGILEAAEGGTVFLDEVGELPESVQAKLLRVVEQKEVVRVGSTEPRKVNVRIISATNRDLQAESKAGRFRSDLYFRLSAVTVNLPPLRARPEDVLPLARIFAKQFAEEMSLPAVALDQGAERWLEAHPWPGNVRELRNRLERGILLQSTGVIGAEHLMDDVEPRSTIEAEPAPRPVENNTEPPRPRTAGGPPTKQEVLDALAAAGGNQKAAAEILKIDRKTLGRYLDKFAIPRPRRG